MRVLYISQEDQKEILNMNALEIEKRYITLAKARIEKKVKLSLTARLNSLEKRLTGHEKVLDERIKNLKSLLKQKMEEISSCIDQISEEKQRATESLALELAKIDRDIREKSVNIVEVEKINFNTLLERVNENKEIVLKRGDVRKIVQEIMQQKEQLLLNGKNATSESESSSEDADVEFSQIGIESESEDSKETVNVSEGTEVEFSQIESESEDEDSKETVNIPDFSPMSPDSDGEPAAKKMKK